MRWAVALVLILGCRRSGVDEMDDSKPVPFAVTIEGTRTSLPYARAVIRDNEVHVVLASTQVTCMGAGELPRALSGTQVRFHRGRGFGEFFPSNFDPPTTITACAPRCVDDVAPVSVVVSEDTTPPFASVKLTPRPGTFEVEGENRIELCPSNSPRQTLPEFEKRSIATAILDGVQAPIEHAITWRTPGKEGIDRLAFYRAEPEDCAAAFAMRPVLALTWPGDAAVLGAALPARIELDGAPVTDGNAAAVDLRSTGAHYAGHAVVATKRASLNGYFSADVCVVPGEERALPSSYDLSVGARTHPLRYALATFDDDELEIAFSDQPLVCDPNGPVPIRDDARTIEIDLPRGLGDYYTATPLARSMRILRSEDEHSSLTGAITLEDLDLGNGTAVVDVAIDSALLEGERVRFAARTAVPLCRRRERPTAAIPRASSNVITAVAIISDGKLDLRIGPGISCATRDAAAHVVETRTEVKVGAQPADYHEDAHTRGASDNAYLRIDTLDRAAGRIRGAFSAVADTTEKTPLSGTFDAPICP